MSTIATIKTIGGKVTAVTYNNQHLITPNIPHILQRELESICDKQALSLQGNYELKAFDNKEVKLMQASREFACGKIAKKIQRAIERQLCYKTVTTHAYLVDVNQTPLNKVTGLLKTVLLEKVVPAKICDAAMLAFFIFAMVLLVVHNPAILAFAGTFMPITSTVFGVLNIALVGPMVLIQALKNAKKALEMRDKKRASFCYCWSLIWSFNNHIWGYLNYSDI